MHDYFIEDHDAQVAVVYEALSGNGCMGLSVDAFGMVYMENSRKRIYVSSNGNQIYNKFMDNLLHSIYPTIIQYKTKRYEVISAGQNEKCHADFKLEFAKEFNEKYSDEILLKLQQISRGCCNSAYPYLIQLAIQNKDYLNENLLHMFTSLVDYAFKIRKLDNRSYLELRRYSEEEKDKLGNIKCTHGNIKRSFSAFYYELGTDHGIYDNAVKYLTYKAQIDLVSKGAFVTPVIEKTYYGRQYDDIRYADEFFRNELTYIFSQPYIEMIKLLNVLPGIISERKKKEYLEKFYKISNDNEYQTVEYYLNLWRGGD